MRKWLLKNGREMESRAQWICPLSGSGMLIFSNRKRRTRDHRPWLEKDPPLPRVTPPPLCGLRDSPVLGLRGSAPSPARPDFHAPFPIAAILFPPQVSMFFLLQFPITLKSVIQCSLLQEALSAYMNFSFLWVLRVPCHPHLAFYYVLFGSLNISYFRSCLQDRIRGPWDSKDVF